MDIYIYSLIVVAIIAAGLVRQLGLRSSLIGIAALSAGLMIECALLSLSSPYITELFSYLNSVALTALTAYLLVRAFGFKDSREALGIQALGILIAAFITFA